MEVASPDNALKIHTVYIKVGMWKERNNPTSYQLAIAMGGLLMGSSERHLSDLPSNNYCSATESSK